VMGTSREDSGGGGARDSGASTVVSGDSYGGAGALPQPSPPQLLPLPDLGSGGYGLASYSSDGLNGGTDATPAYGALQWTGEPRQQGWSTPAQLPSGSGLAHIAEPASTNASASGSGSASSRLPSGVR
jgi:hypothetical protein